MRLTRVQKMLIGAVAIGALAGILTTLLQTSPRQRQIVLSGTVIRKESDPRKESPIADVQITAANGMGAAGAKTDFSGFFQLRLRSGIRLGQTITLQFRHPNYRPLNLYAAVWDKLYVVRMVPLHPDITPAARPTAPRHVVSNVRVRYSVQTNNTVNIGAGIKTFQVVNTGNIPCEGYSPCSPDGKWKAAVASAFLDAGRGNVFENPRVSCIAGPCPFTRIDSLKLSQGGRIVTAQVRDWSDTATFLLQAEAFQHQVGEVVHIYYPIIFGRSLNFSLPKGAQGPCLEAALNGVAIVFPIPPNLQTTWTDCKVRPNQDQSQLFRCELKPGYVFHK